MAITVPKIYGISVFYKKEISLQDYYSSFIFYLRLEPTVSLFILTCLNLLNKIALSYVLS